MRDHLKNVMINAPTKTMHSYFSCIPAYAMQNTQYNIGISLKLVCMQHSWIICACMNTSHVVLR